MPQHDGFKKFKADIPGMLKKIDRIETMAQTCDHRIIDEMTGVNNFLERNRQFSETKEYTLLATDINILKTDIMDHCMCPRRK